MSTTAIVGIVIAVIVVAVFVALTVRMVTQRRALKDRFGDEYDRTVADKGGRAAAEAELRERQRRHADLPLTELSADDRARFSERWTEVQGEFVNDPAAAVHAADRLVSRIVADRGYPVVDYADRLAHLSVDHARVLHDYRDAHEVSVRNDAGQATTEELRQALVHYRALVADLLGEPDLNRTTAALPGGTPLAGTAPSTAAIVDPDVNPGTEMDTAPEPVREPTLVPDVPTPIEETRP